MWDEFFGNVLRCRWWPSMASSSSCCLILVFVDVSWIGLSVSTHGIWFVYSRSWKSVCTWRAWWGVAVYAFPCVWVSLGARHVSRYSCPQGARLVCVVGTVGEFPSAVWVAWICVGSRVGGGLSILRMPSCAQGGQKGVCVVGCDTVVLAMQLFARDRSHS